MSSSRRSRRARSKKEKSPEETIAAAPDFSSLEAYGEDDDFYRKWSGPVLLGSFLPAIFSLLIIFSGQLILNSFEGSCGYPLDGFVSAQVAVCYLYLLVFTWVYMGDNIFIDIPAFSFKRQILFPFKSLRWVMGAYAAVGFVLFIVAIIGAAILSLAIFCQSTSPQLYTFSLFLVAIDWIGMFITVAYLIKTSFGGQIAQFIVEKTKAESVSDVELRIFKKKFDEIDLEGTGKVTRENAQKIIQNLGIFVPEEEMNQLMDTLDPGQTDIVEYDPFFQWFQALSAEADERDPAARRGGQEGPSAEDYYSDDD